MHIKEVPKICEKCVPEFSASLSNLKYISQGHTMKWLVFLTQIGICARSLIATYKTGVIFIAIWKFGSQESRTLTWNMNTTRDWQILANYDAGTLHVSVYNTYEKPYD